MDAQEFRRAWRGAQMTEWRQKGPKIALGVLVLLAALTAVFSCTFVVEPDETGVVTRFGAYHRKEDPGLHFKWPWGMENVQLVKTRKVLNEEFGFRTAHAGVRTQYDPREFDAESLMLSGDLNIADVEWDVQFRVSDPEKFLFHVRNAVGTLRDASESVMREVVGDRSVTEVLTEGRAEINAEVARRLQELLDRYECGLSIVLVKLQDVNPPEAVKPAFNEVNQAKQEKEETINHALQEYNRVVPRARGEAAQQIAEAEGYRIERVNRAQGDARRFLSILEQYRKAPEVTRQRLYLETMRRVLPSVERKIVSDEALGGGLLPLLHLEGEAPSGAGASAGRRAPARRHDTSPAGGKS